MPTTASSPPTTLTPASHTAPALVRHCHEAHRVGPIQGRRIASTSDGAPLERAVTQDPTAEMRCPGEGSVAAGLKGYYGLAGAKEPGGGRDHSTVDSARRRPAGVRYAPHNSSFSCGSEVRTRRSRRSVPGCRSLSAAKCVQRRLTRCRGNGAIDLGLANVPVLGRKEKTNQTLPAWI